MNSEQWLQERTYHHSSFWDLRQLVEEKRRQGLKISLCLPTLNEAKTIGKVIVILKSALKDQYPLVDEIAVIDSGSTDDTREIAAKFGADVYLAEEHLTEVGDRKGKGENLWKALYLLDGDIICYVDTDIKNIHPRFVYGLVAPLVQNPDIHYVKAFYDRPLAFSQGIRPTGGGRVTEILVRPLFSLFYPELAAIIQPLSGEYAGRRSILEQIPFPVGYGVETAMLIDIYEKLGLSAFAQTDLDTRVHRNQETIALGRMAFGILRTFFNRLTRQERIGLEQALPTIMRQHRVEDGSFEQIEYNIEEFERPPIMEIETYRDKFHSSQKTDPTDAASE
ncbi:glucosyl-3-phosphoglycerate synthase [Stratiformator vulcanicus]|uniref:Glucosyl-3-phosphoglycerate synthase n=1 Tax=Stratiformator vulcanicus TaxID=2527980 RepID=A0A517R1Z5_9PLAN|nr:glucosyl-3-phosphoglycerate synthase [Stratiformator vulcanicus]QDT37892.1 Glucosyl-3-phosphoglycerate synthase [Stratiformator vulcanicus]